MAIDRVNFYLQQLVTEAHLDGAFDDVEDAIKNLSLDAGAKQAKSTDSPTMIEHGGIVSGLEVTDLGGELVQVALGQARDHLGRRAKVPSNASISIQYAGATEEGDVSSAQGDGAAITGSCPSGQDIIASLFLVFDQHIYTDVIDGASTPLKYNYDQSFHFDIQVGAAGTPASSRAALSDGKILLADLLLYNNWGTLEVVAVCVNNENWDALVARHATYAAYTGRRSDCMAFDNETSYPRFSAENVTRRYSSVRGAISGLFTDLQRSASTPAGASLLGARAQSGAGLAAVAEAAATLSAGSIDAQLLYLLNRINEKLGRGGGSIIPPAGGNGLVFDPTNLDADKFVLAIKGLLGGSIGNTVQFNKYGLPIPGTYFFDDFLYKPTAASGEWDPSTAPFWGPYAGVAAAGTTSLSDILGGAAHFICGASAGAFSGIRVADGGITNGRRGQFSAAAGSQMAAYAYCRGTTATAILRCGFVDLDNSGLIEVIADLGAGTIKAHVINSAGGGEVSSSSLGSPVQNQFAGIGIAVTGINKAKAFVTGFGAEVEATLSTGDFGSGKYALFFAVQTSAPSAEEADLDRICAIDKNQRVSTLA